jgi:hypothetical protein
MKTVKRSEFQGVRESNINVITGLSDALECLTNTQE